MKRNPHSVPSSGPQMFDQLGKRKYLNPREREAFLRTVLRHPDVAERAFCLTLFFTGSRISETLLLDVERVDLAEGALVLETLKQRRKGQFRSIPVPELLIREIRSLIQQNAQGRVWNFSRTTAWRLVKDMMRIAGLEGVKATPKGLRHSYAIACLGSGIPLTTIRKWMGHARLETTTIYLDAVGEEERELAKRLWDSCIAIHEARV